MSAVLSAADIADRLTLKKHPRSWRGACPTCSYPGAFSMKAGKDTRPNLYCANGCTREQLAGTLAHRLGAGWKPPTAQPGDAAAENAARERKSARAVAIFNGSTTIAAHDPAGRYLASRHIGHLIRSAALRFRGDCNHPEGGRYPALVALVHDGAGNPVALHRTYLTSAGRKAAAEPAKASLGPVWNGAIRLHPSAPEMVIGEGIETAASAGLLLALPVWAAINAGNLARAMILPPEVRAVVIAADNDTAGTKAAHEAAARWRAEGRRVRIAWPDAPGQDFNDLLAIRAEAQLHAA